MNIGRVGLVSGALVSIEVDLATKGLDKDLATLWRLERLALVDCVHSHRLFWGLVRLIIPLIEFFATVFLSQGRPCLKISEIRMTLLIAGF